MMNPVTQTAGMTPRSGRAMPATSAQRRADWLGLFALLAYTGVACSTGNSYYQLIFTLVPIWACAGVAWNLFSGWCGLVSFGHAAFFGLGAFTVALLDIRLGVTPWFGLLAAGGVGAAAALLIGLPTFRLRGLYFALAMLAYPLALLYLFEWLGWSEMTLPMRRGDGWVAMQFSDARWNIVVAMLLLAAAAWVHLRVARSRFGLSLLAIKEDELAAQAAGIDAFACKLRALALSGAITGAVGGFYAVVLLVVTPSSVFGMLTSAEALMVVLFGGVAEVAGPLLGALVLVPLGEVLNAKLGTRLPGIQGVVYGTAIVASVLFAPRGLLPALKHWFEPRRKARAQVLPQALDASPFLREARAAGAAQEPLLRVEHLSKAFGGLCALDDLSFEVRSAEILGIIGPNGAGKTTLFNVLNGVLAPSSGRVSLSGRDITGLPPHRLRCAGIARTFQVVRPFPRLSLLDNVAVGAFHAHADDAEAYDAARAALARVGLGSMACAPAATLSTVQLRLMELARALCGAPRIVLLDEILAGLGAQEVEHAVKVIAGLRRDGMTVVIIEHTMHAMVRLADRLLVLDHGRLLACGEPEVVTQEPRVIEAYLGKRWVDRAAHL